MEKANNRGASPPSQTEEAMLDDGQNQAYPTEPPPKYSGSSRGNNQADNPYDNSQPGAPYGNNPTTGAYAPQMVQVGTILSPQFGDLPVQCTCSNCSRPIVTNIEKESGLLVWLICLALVLIGCWLGCCLIPFCIDDLKDTTHYCPQCRTMLGKHKRL